MKKATPGMVALLRACSSNDFEVASKAQKQLSIALTLPLRQGKLYGDIIGDIYLEEDYSNGAIARYPIDFITAGNEASHVAFVVPNTGYIPEKQVNGDYVMVPTFDTAYALDVPLKYLRDSGWNVADRMMKVIKAAHTKKNNDDGFAAILASGASRGIMPYDDFASAGLFTKRLVNLLQISTRRNAGGNSSSVARGNLTRLYVSPESFGDSKSWDLTQIDDFTRRQIWLSNDEDGMVIFGTMVKALDELGVGQIYQKYFANTLAGTMPTDKVEICIGVDTNESTGSSFVSPVREEPEVVVDTNLHRQRRFGMYATCEKGYGCLDSTKVILGAI